MITPEHRVAVVNGGAGVVARFDDDIIVVGGGSSAVAELMAGIAPLQPGGAPQKIGTALAEELRMARDVSVAAMVHTPTGVEIVELGNGMAAASDGQRLEPTSPVMWIGIGPAPTDAATRLDTLTHLDLRLGAVPGQGALVTSPVSDSADHFEIIDLQAPTSAAETDPRAPLPVAEAPAAPRDTPPDTPPPSGGSKVEVLGIRCSRDHFNNPRAAYCQVCGISMVHITHYLVPGARPTLGFLVFDDGATFALDRSYCVGREPTITEGRDLTPLVLADERHSVSRSHAELVIDGWDLQVHDLGSTNGTFVWDANGQVWNRVMPGQHVTVDPGTSVAIGRKVFVYETVARST